MSDSFVTPWTVALQASLSTGFSRQEYWSGFPFHLSILTLSFFHFSPGTFLNYLFHWLFLFTEPLLIWLLLSSVAESAIPSITNNQTAKSRVPFSLFKLLTILFSFDFWHFLSHWFFFYDFVSFWICPWLLSAFFFVALDFLSFVVYHFPFHSMSLNFQRFQHSGPYEYLFSNSISRLLDPHTRMHHFSCSLARKLIILITLSFFHSFPKFLDIGSIQHTFSHFPLGYFI